MTTQTNVRAQKAGQHVFGIQITFRPHKAPFVSLRIAFKQRVFIFGAV